MKKFNEFLAERAGKGLTIFDIDDTLFVSKARVIVRNTNTGKTKALTPMEFNTYKLRNNEVYDYGEFKSARIFYQTATPIGRIVTARANMDDKKLFIKTLESHGLPMKDVYVERAGNMSGSSAENKQIIFRKYLKTGEYARIRLFDDHKENLQALLDLKREFPTVEMFAYLADLKGSVKRIK